MSLHSHDIDLFAPRRIDEARAKKKRTPSKAKGAKRRRPIETKTDLQLPHDVSVHASAHINDPIAMKHHAIASALGRDPRSGGNPRGRCVGKRTPCTAGETVHFAAA